MLQALIHWLIACHFCPHEKANRDRGILQAIAKAADWNKALPAGVFRGIAETEGYGSYTACVCEVWSMPKARYAYTAL
jgi:hypothetical protein